MSILAGEASARFTQVMNTTGVFDCRIVSLPGNSQVTDYFRWRMEDAHRNALNAWAYWTLRGNGLTRAESTRSLEGKSVAFKNQLLFENGINFNNLPEWQKRGIGLRRHRQQALVKNPQTGVWVTTSRPVLQVNMSLPIGIEYENWIRQVLLNCDNNEDG